MNPPVCPACDDHYEPHDYPDYQGFCSQSCYDERPMLGTTMTEEELPWRIAAQPDGTFTMTRGSGPTEVMTREQAEHVVEQLAALLGSADDVDQWMKWGYDQGWCSPPVCAEHDGVPMSEDEYEIGEVCCHVIRMYEDAATKAAVEADCGPAVWRATNRGWGSAKTPETASLQAELGAGAAQVDHPANSGARGVFP